MTTSLYADVWNTVFAGGTYPGPLWLDEHHPSMAGYDAIDAVVGSLMSDPGSRPVFAIGDSWLNLRGLGLTSSLSAHFGHSISVTIADFFGHDLDYQLGQWWSRITSGGANDPVYVISYMGYVHELAESVAFAQQNTRRLMSLCSFFNTRLICLGVAPAPAPDDTAAAALYPAIKSTLGF